MTVSKKDAPQTGQEALEQQGKPNPKQQTQNEAQSQPTQGPLIYVGPNIPGGRLMQYTVFRGGIPDYLDDLLEKQPAIRQLLVPVQDLSSVQVRISTPGTLEHTFYQRVKDGGK
ncbi:hypothetical protein J31TS6_40370 [Brevibacillus reuszeri]|uniref:hypothetical protein n=1 Tax=Brevibacillus reuszeri TaxID=54915 RepID=UPI001B22D4A6|nr:hypothetical protein [Brevibacillus reuszeri]GIO08009.1 hypothetical protein J31TS6_40370 [Brevibacillus reuszeri]